MSQIKRLTSFLKLSTGEGDRIVYSYSTIDTDTGKVISQNEKGNFVVLNDEVATHISAIEGYIKENMLN